MFKLSKSFYSGHHTWRRLLIFALFFILPMIRPALLAQGRIPKREMRAVWVATVRNIDWPSRPGLTVTRMKDEMIKLLDLHKKNGMNCIVFQPYFLKYQR